MNGFGFYMDLTTCIGCRSCQFACGQAHGLGEGEWFRRVLLVEPEEGQRYQGAYSAACNHCEEPACVAACQTGAMYRDEESGAIRHDDARCIGCGACTWACPYGAVSLCRGTGKAHKCDSCAERRLRGEEPVCVAVCPTRSLRFGVVKDFEERGARVPSYSFLPDPERTRPSTRVTGRRDAV